MSTVLTDRELDLVNEATAELREANSDLREALAEETPVIEDLLAELGEEFFANMPRPLYWRVLVRPKQPAKMTKGGIALPQETRIAEGYRNYVGQILAAGGEAFHSERFAREKNLPKVGEWVVYGRYAGQRLEYRGELLLICNDDEILGVVKDPENLRIYT